MSCVFVIIFSSPTFNTSYFTSDTNGHEFTLEVRGEKIKRTEKFGFRLHYNGSKPVRFQFAVKKESYRWDESWSGLRRLYSGRFEDIDYFTLESLGIHLDEATVYCDVYVYDSLPKISTGVKFDDAKTQLMSKINESSLQSDLSNSKDNEFLTDFTIQCDDENFPCHRLILSSRSSVLRAMLQPHTKEAHSAKLVISDASKECVKWLLEYIYTDTCSELSKNALEVFFIADKYNVEGLKAKAIMELMEQVNVENAADLYIKVHPYMNCQEFLSFLSKFIKANLTEVKDTEGWKKLTKDHLNLVVNFI